jgi:hypothetical protein
MAVCGHYGAFKRRPTAAAASKCRGRGSRGECAQPSHHYPRPQHRRPPTRDAAPQCPFLWGAQNIFLAEDDLSILPVLQGILIIEWGASQWSKAEQTGDEILLRAKRTGDIGACIVGCLKANGRLRAATGLSSDAQRLQQHPDAVAGAHAENGRSLLIISPPLARGEQGTVAAIRAGLGRPDGCDCYGERLVRASRVKGVTAANNRSALARFQAVGAIARSERLQLAPLAVAYQAWFLVTSCQPARRVPLA